MENNVVEKTDLIVKITDIIKKKKKLLLIISFTSILILFSVIFFNIFQEKKNSKISEKYIQAGIYLSSNEKKKSNILYKEIIFSKNKFYSILALNTIIENDLEKDSGEILKLFEIIDKMNINNNHKDLIKLKKALYLKKVLKDTEGDKLLNEIIAENSVWKDTALEILK